MWSERDFFDKRVRTKPFDPPPKPPVRTLYKVSRRHKALIWWACGPCQPDYRPRNWSLDKTKAVNYPSDIATKFKHTIREDYGWACKIQLHPTEYPNDTPYGG